jgi:hypothetical protein
VPGIRVCATDIWRIELIAIALLDVASGGDLLGGRQVILLTTIPC